MIANLDHENMRLLAAELKTAQKTIKELQRRIELAKNQLKFVDVALSGHVE